MLTSLLSSYHILFDIYFLLENCFIHFFTWIHKQQKFYIRRNIIFNIDLYLQEILKHGF